MNIFVGVGEIQQVEQTEKHVRFVFATRQEKPAKIPCIVFDPSEELREVIKNLESTRPTVWLRGKVSTFEFDAKGKKIVKVVVIAHPLNIRQV